MLKQGVMHTPVAPASPHVCTVTCTLVVHQVPRSITRVYPIVPGARRVIAAQVTFIYSGLCANASASASVSASASASLCPPL